MTSSHYYSLAAVHYISCQLAFIQGLPIRVHTINDFTDSQAFDHYFPIYIKNNFIRLGVINSCLNYPEYYIDIFSPDNDVIWVAAVQRPLTVQSVLSIGLSAQPVRSTILTLVLSECGLPSYA